ncbi:MAG: ATP-binding protein [Bacteroidota bacterium]|nr:ATP-binding protein [Bacteroidota bacterium]
MDTTTEFRKFSANLDSLEPIREFLTGLANKLGLDKSRTYKLCLAVDEIATNIINYGYLKSGITDGMIDVIVDSNKELLTVTLEDTAIPFNPFENKLPGEVDLALPLEERPIGGLGIMLAKENVDEFRYEFENGKNRNIFCVNLK